MRKNQMHFTESNSLVTIFKEEMKKIQVIKEETSKSIKNRNLQRDKLIAEHAKSERSKAKTDTDMFRTKGTTKEQEVLLALLTKQHTELVQCRTLVLQNDEWHQKLVPAVRTVLDQDAEICKIIHSKDYPSCIKMRNEILGTLTQLYDKYNETWEFLFEHGTSEYITEKLEAARQRTISKVPVPAAPESKTEVEDTSKSSLYVIPASKQEVV